MEQYDVVIIGAGILGVMTARELSRYRLNVLVVEQAYDVGEGATKANSGVLYAGFHPRGGSLKGISCVQGNRRYRALCEELHVPVSYLGSLFVAFHREGIAALQEKLRRGIQNGAEGLKIIDGREARNMEPELSPHILKALYAPATAILSPFQLILSTAQSAKLNGVDFRFDAKVLALHSPKKGAPYVLSTSQGEVRAHYIVNTAGEQAAPIEHFVRPADLIIKPKRGQYYVLDKSRSSALLKHVIYQAQENNEGGTLLTPTVEGNLLIGPTSEDVANFHCNQTTAEGLAHLARVAKKVIPPIDMNDVITNFAGVRANITNVAKEDKDFVLRVSAPRMVSALGIKNPGMTAAPYLAEKLVELLQSEGLPLRKNKQFIAEYPTNLPFLQQSSSEQARLFARDSSYGKIVCRCEQITEGDISRVLNEPLPPRSLNGLKKRLRIGMGRCQGAFCTPNVIDILCRKQNITPTQVLKSTGGSFLVKGELRK